ncbi:MAG: SDR family NAD(P)-dependent oxidoreductase [Myxococcaceae bacterium]|nr:SDR family NAD(P)-dependent oxidoreductase [Myxococcaceae bacterium]
MNEQLPCRTALITGASSGLGRGLARWFATRGVQVFAAARREQQLEELAKECREAGGKLEPMRLDVSDSDDTIRRIRELDERVGGLDLVIANAGVGADTPAKRLEWEDVKRIIDVNVTGAAATLCAVLPRMVERDRGHLVGISSLAAYRGLPGSGAYSASKAFLYIFLEGLRVDLQRTHIKVTSIHPGFVKSEMTARNKFPMPFLLETDDAVERMARAIVRGDSEFAFPWQTSSLMKFAKVLPNGAWNMVARRMMR